MASPRMSSALVPCPLALRDRPDVDLQLQRPRRRRADGSAARWGSDTSSKAASAGPVTDSGDAQLIDAATRNHVWAERLRSRDRGHLRSPGRDHRSDRRGRGAGARQRRAAARAPPPAGQPRRLERLPAGPLARLSLQQGRQRRSARLFEQAIALDNQFAPAHAGRSFAQFSIAFPRLFRSPGRGHGAGLPGSQAKRRARRQRTHSAIGRWRARISCGREHEQALAELEAALDLNPSFAQAHYFRGWTLTVAGRPQEALAHLDKAYRLSPRDPLLFAFMAVRAQTLITMGRHEEALDMGDQSGEAVQRPCSRLGTSCLEPRATSAGSTRPNALSASLCGGDQTILAGWLKHPSLIAAGKISSTISKACARLACRSNLAECGRWPRTSSSSRLPFNALNHRYCPFTLCSEGEMTREISWPVS